MSLEEQEQALHLQSELTEKCHKRVADVDLTELEQVQWALPSMLPVPTFSQPAL